MFWKLNELLLKLHISLGLALTYLCFLLRCFIFVDHRIECQSSIIFHQVSIIFHRPSFCVKLCYKQSSNRLIMRGSKSIAAFLCMIKPSTSIQFNLGPQTQSTAEILHSIMFLLRIYINSANSEEENFEHEKLPLFSYFTYFARLEENFKWPMKLNVDHLRGTTKVEDFGLEYIYWLWENLKNTFAQKVDKSQVSVYVASFSFSLLLNR